MFKLPPKHTLELSGDYLKGNYKKDCRGGELLVFTIDGKKSRNMCGKYPSFGKLDSNCDPDYCPYNSPEYHDSCDMGWGKKWDEWGEVEVDDIYNDQWHLQIVGKESIDTLVEVLFSNKWSARRDLNISIKSWKWSGSQPEANKCDAKIPMLDGKNSPTTDGRFTRWFQDKVWTWTQFVIPYGKELSCKGQRLKKLGKAQFTYKYVWLPAFENRWDPRNPRPEACEKRTVPKYDKQNFCR